MAEIHTLNGTLGVESISSRRKFHPESEPSFRLWIDRGRGKYGALQITYAELERFHKMLSGVLGGSHSKPSRRKVDT
jgi:hypothetical protein